MKLYKDYKEEQEFHKKENEDRKNLGIPPETTIIYERTTTTAATIIKSITSFLLLVMIIAAMVAGIITLAVYLQ